MSNFGAWATNPATGLVEIATYIDNHFGPHRYGVRFGDGSIYPAEDVKRMESPAHDRP